MKRAKKAYKITAVLLAVVKYEYFTNCNVKLSFFR